MCSSDLVAATAATALAALGVEAAKAAIKDERDTARLNAALKARGILTDDLKGKIDEQTRAMAALGITDDQVRAGIETGSRFFKSQTDILQANTVAADIAAVTGQSLSEVMMAIGRGVNGSTRGLTSLGIKVKEGAKLQDILTAATKKYGGASKEIANTTAGKFAAAQIRISEAFEKLGYSLLPTVSKVLDLFGTRILPAVEGAFAKLGPVIESIAGFLFDTLVPAISELYDKHLAPLIDEVGKLATALWGDGSGPLAIAVGAIGKAFEVFAGIVGGIVDTITILIKLIERALELFGAFGNAARSNPVLGSGVALPSGVSIPGYGGISTTVNLSIGQDKFDEVVTGSLERAGFRRGGTP